MGAWNIGLFDNDDALDKVHVVEERLGLLPNFEDPDPDHAEPTQAELAAIIDTRMAGMDWSGYDAYQNVILAAYLMRTGAKLPDEIRQRAQESIGEAAAEEGYFFQEAQDEVSAALERYKDGSPWPFFGKGLFETMAEKADMGIINVPPRTPGGI